MATQTDVMVLLEDRPGMVARVGEALGAAGINIEGVCALVNGGHGILHVLLPAGSDAAARAALEGAGLDIHTIREVWVAQCPDRPGELGALMRRLAAVDVNLDLVYLTTNGRLVIGTEELERVTGILS